MKSKVILTFALMFVMLIGKAQQTAMQFTGVDCNNNPVDLYADLNSGKAVVLFYYMANCASCPPPAQKIQTMANNVMNTYPGMVKAYAYPFSNATSCTYSNSWVTNNNLSLYTPMDSGATQVAYYGGFGMPTVVLVGGTDHRVLFVTQSFTTSDTTIMRDSILNLLSPSSIQNVQNTIASVNLFPNPASDNLHVELQLTQPTDLTIEVVNVLGETVSSVFNGQVLSGMMNTDIATQNLSNGNYFIRVRSIHGVQNYRFTVTH